jgi:anti-sigma28 factor (negative regulator of flagellin synthesis)
MPVWDPDRRMVMRISDTELKKVVDSSGYALVESENGFETSPREDDGPMIQKLIQDVIAMPDREEMIASLKERIAKGEYRPAAEDIADVMYRRSIADKIR